MASSFGRLALGAVGAVIGAPFGLSAIGFSIGSALGGFLFTPEVEGPDIEGPRVGDTDVTTSSLGKPIPEHYGVTRVAGNVFWSAGLKEVKTVTDSGGGGGKGGGGGGGGSQTTYDYFGNFATAFGRGPAEAVLRLWADGKLIYDVNGSGDVQNDKYKFRFRKGRSGQGVDNLIKESINRRLAGLPDVNEGNGPQASFRTINDLIAESATAAAGGDKRAAIYQTYLTQLRDNADTSGTVPDYSFTPAYRDTCYIIFEDMPLKDFGNRLPNITAEIAWGTYSNAVTTATSQPRESNVPQNSTNTSTPATGVAVDVFKEILVVQSGDRLRIFSATSSSETLNKPATGGQSNSTVDTLIGAAANGDVIAKATPALGQQTLVKVSTSSLLISGDYDNNSSGPHTITRGGADITFGASLGSNSGTDLFGGVRPDGQYYVFRTNQSNIDRVYGGPASGTGPGQIPADYALIGDGPVVNGGKGINYILASDTTQYRLYKIDVDWGVQGPNNNFYLNVTPQTLTGLTNLNGQTVSSLIYDPSADRLYGLFRTGTTSGRIIKYNVDGSEIYNRTLTLAPPNDVSGLQRSSISTGKLIYARDDDVAEIDLNTGDETVYNNVLSGNVTPDVQLYIGSRDAVFTWIGSQPVKIEAGRNLATSAFQSETTVQKVVQEICARTGMASDEYDVSGVNSTQIIRGYTVGRPSTGRAALEKLLTSYFIEGIESDYTIKFRDKTSTSVRSLTEDELGTIKGPTGEVNFLESRAPEYNLPAEMNIAFVDQFRDYQQGAASYRRVSQPKPSMYSFKKQNLELPIVFSEAEAADIAQRLMFLTWLSRDTAKTKLSWTHLDLDPGDVIQITFNDGRTITDRIAKHTTGANFEINVETARSGDPVYVQSTLSPITSTGVPSNGIVTPLYTDLFVLDIPLLEDFHDMGRTALRYYTVVGSDTSTWLSATLYSSLDNDQYRSFDTHTIDISWGQCQNVLGAPRAPFTTDIENTLTIQFVVNNSDIASVTFDQIVNNNANRALVYNSDTGVGEIIQFQTVTNNADGTVTLSNLTRGLRGTDYAMYDHTQGEFFLFLPDTGYRTHTNPLDMLGSTQYFRAVSAGALLASTATKNVTWEGRDIKPYAPSRVNRQTIGGDIRVTWVRRTRIGGEWNMIGGASEVVPLNEDSEEYEFFLLPKTLPVGYVFDPDDVNSFVSSHIVGTPEFTITAAALLAAGYALADDLNVAVCQRSVQAGRGFIAQGTLPA